MDNRRYHDFPLEFSVSQCRKFSWGSPFWIWKIWGSEKLYDELGVMTIFSSKIFSITVPKIFVRNSFPSQEISVMEKLMDKRGGYHVFQSKVFSLTVPKNIVGEPFWVSKNLGFGKILCIIEGHHSIIEGHHVFPSVFWSHSTEKFCGEPFCVSQFSGSEKSFGWEGCGLSRFSVERSLSHSLKKLLRGPFSVWQIFGYRKIFCKKGAVRFYKDYFISHSTETLLGEAFSVSLISGIEKIHAQEGYNTIFCPNFYVSQYRKFL